MAGNHDLFSIGKTPAHIKGFEFPPDWYDLDYPTRERLSDGRVWLYEKDELRSLISDDNKDFVAALPEYAVTECGGGYKILLSHYAFPDPTGSLIWKVTEPNQLAEHFEFMKNNGCLYGFSGHDHFEGIKIFADDFVKTVPFGEKYVLPDRPLWMHIPTVSNGTFKNGLAVYDTDTREIEATPLNTPPYIYRKQQ